MSQGVINIESDLYVNTQGGQGNAIVTRGDSIIAINSSGTHTVQMNGNVNFNYDGSTSGTKVDADVDITLSGADSYWNGNTLISWNDTPSDSSKLDVSEMTLTVKDGATWTPTAISNSDSQKYTALNKLTLDGGIVDVNKGVAITIENIDGKGAITNAGSVTIEKGSIEGPITFEKGGATADNMVTVGEDGITTLTGGVAGSGTIDKLAIAEDGKTTITNAKLSGHEGRALWNNGTLTINGGSFEGNKANVAGAIYNADGATLTVDGVTFASNSSAIAGAINNSDGTVTITNSTFKGNTALAGIGQGGAITNADEMTITGSTFEGNQAGKLGGAIFNAANGKLTFNGTNTFTNNTAAGNTNDIYNAGTITVADGTTTLNSGLKQVGGNITVKGGTLDMASGSSLSFDTSSTLTINGGAFVADFGQLLTDYATTNTANGITDESIIGTSGNLNLRLNGGYYTLEQYNAAKGALLGQADVPEDATLNFLNATLDTEGKDLVVGADKDGTEVTITMTPVVVDAGEAPDAADPDAHIPSVPNQIVSVVAADDDGDEKKLLEADTITVSGSKFTAKGLQIAGTENAEAVTLDVTDGSSLTLTGGEAGFTGVVNAENEAVATNVKVEGNATLTVGLEGNEKAQNLVLNAVEVADGSFEVAGNGLDTTQVAANTLEVVDAHGSVAVDKASLSVENTVVKGGLLNITNTVADLGTVKAIGGVISFDPSYGRLSFDGNVGSTIPVGDGSVVNVTSGLDNLQELAQKAGFTTLDQGNGEFFLGTGESMLAVGQTITLDDLTRSHFIILEKI